MSLRTSNNKTIEVPDGNHKMINVSINEYMTGINSFDGSTSLAFGPSNITISCMNTFFAAFKQMETKIRHTKNMVIKVDEFCRSLENILDDEQQMFRNIEKLSESRFTNKIKDCVILNFGYFSINSFNAI